MARYQPNADPPARPASAALARRIAHELGSPTTEGLSPDSPDWWRERLLARLYERRTRLETYEAYYDGVHRLAFATDKFREAFGNLFSAFADNWCDLVVDASVERIGVEGFRFGERSTASRLAPAADSKAWELWQANGLDAEADLAHLDAVKLGETYILVTPGDPGEEYPRVQIEHPAQAVVEVNPARPRERVAGLRVWLDEPAGVQTCVLYRPEAVYWWARPAATAAKASGGWEPVADETGRNPLGVVPLLALRNNPQLRDHAGRSDLARVIPIQDAINKLATDMLVASEFAAFRQRWATGIEVPTDGPDGKPPANFLAAVSRAWAVEDKDVRFGEFEASDLSNYVSAVEALIQHVAAQTRTPPHYLLGSSGNFPSGESLKATETGLVAKVRRKHRLFGETWEEAMRLAFAIMGDTTRAEAQDAETIWRDPESRSEGERTDALVKMSTLGVPHEALWARWGATPQEVDQWRAMREAQAPPTPPPGTQIPPAMGGGANGSVGDPAQLAPGGAPDPTAAA
jgi:hypothetical protein